MPLPSTKHILISSSTIPKYFHKPYNPLAGLFWFQEKMKAGAMELGAAAAVAHSGLNRGVAILDFILRLVAIVATLASAVAMGTTNETLPFFTQFIRFRAQYEDFPTFTWVHSFRSSNICVYNYMFHACSCEIY